jgi:hypothetical protein
LEAEKDDLLREKIRKNQSISRNVHFTISFVTKYSSVISGIAVSTKFPGLSSSKSAEEEEEEGRAARVPACYY